MMAYPYSPDGNGDIPAEDLIGATYARISTAQQKDGISLSDQDARMNAYAAMQHIIVPPEYRYKEQASGFKDERTEYDKIRELVKSRKIHVLVIYGSDRHTREPIHGEIFRSELRRNNVSLHIITEGGEVDIVSPTGQFMRRQMDNFNWYWGKMIQQTTMDKKRAYIAAGIPGLQGQVPFGYRRVGKQGNAKFEIVEEEAVTIRRIFRLYDEGYTTSEILTFLSGTPTPAQLRGRAVRRGTHEWMPSTVYDILREEVYAGVYYADKFTSYEGEDGKRHMAARPREDWKPMSVPAIVSRELWERVQTRLTNSVNRLLPGRSKHEYLLTRRTKCAHCGLRITGQPTQTTILYYRCNSTSKNTARPPCGLGLLRVDKVDAKVWEFTKELLADDEALASALDSAAEQQEKDNAALLERITELDATIEDLTGQLHTLVQEFRQAKGSILFAVMQQQAAELEARIVGVQEEKAKLQKKHDQYVLTEEDKKAFRLYAAEVRPKLPYATFQDKRDIIEALGFTFTLERQDKDIVIVVSWLVYNFTLRILGEVSSNSTN